VLKRLRTVKQRYKPARILPVKELAFTDKPAVIEQLIQPIIWWEWPPNLLQAERVQRGGLQARARLF